jgi:hypothetical protein
VAAELLLVERLVEQAQQRVLEAGNPSGQSRPQAVQVARSAPIVATIAIAAEDHCYLQLEEQAAQQECFVHWLVEEPVCYFDTELVELGLQVADIASFLAAVMAAHHFVSLLKAQAAEALLVEYLPEHHNMKLQLC